MAGFVTARIENSGALRAGLMAGAVRSADAIRAMLVEGLTPILANTRDNWPVDVTRKPPHNPHSRYRFHLDAPRRGWYVTVTIVNDAEYSPRVYYKGLDMGSHPPQGPGITRWIDYIETPMIARPYHGAALARGVTRMALLPRLKRDARAIIAREMSTRPRSA